MFRFTNWLTWLSCLGSNKDTSMVYYNNNELKDLIAAKLTVEQIMDILGWEMADLVEALSDDIDLFHEDFEDAVA